MTDATPVAPFDTLPRAAKVDLFVLALATVGLCLRLLPDWRTNPDLSHGYFMPIVFVVLLFEARRGTPRFLPNGPLTRLAFGAATGLGLAALVVTGLYAAAVDWSHPLVNWTLTFAYMLLLAAALVVFAGRGMRFIGCNWNAVVAILLWLLSTPIPPGTYTRLTLALQLGVSESVLRTLHVLGVAAIRHGNIIELARATVGVEEACSGIRSLISCVFVGLFFSATLVRRPGSRAAIIVLAAPLAVVMNFFRSLTLTLLANNGVDISGKWHDLTGFAVLGLTAALLAGLALALERRDRAGRNNVAVGVVEKRPRGQLATLTAALATAGVLVAISVANTRPSVRKDAPVPDLLALLPETAPGWSVTTSDELYQFRSTLQTDHLAQRTYRKPGRDGVVTELILYVAYWRAGQAPVSLVASHTPDACWPGSGWAAQPTPHDRAQLTTQGKNVPPAEYRFFKLGDFPQYVWFWHIYDGQPITYRDPYSPLELLRIAWNYGFRHDGDQLFIRVSSNRPWNDLANEPLIDDFFRRVRPLGL